jgi:16S rRNA (adenine1518-N6/adenine1519-N6)-dimethyltransferase
MSVRRQLAEWNLRPSRGLGQNFLVDGTVAARIVDSAELAPCDTVLEVGAGLGALTGLLAQQARRVVAVEIDRRLIDPLRAAVEHAHNVAVVEGDILSLDPAALVGAPREQYIIVANLPYYITSAVLRHLLETACRPKRMVVTVQREVAERIVAEPGQMSLLALSVQYYGTPHLLFRVKPGSFYPSPEVESAVLRIDLHGEVPLTGDDPGAFFEVARAGFAQRRKQLRNALAAGLGISTSEAVALLGRAGIDTRRRAQSLSLEEWGSIVHEYCQ